MKKYHKMTKPKIDNKLPKQIERPCRLRQRRAPVRRMAPLLPGRHQRGRCPEE